MQVVPHPSLWSGARQETGCCRTVCTDPALELVPTRDAENLVRSAWRFCPPPQRCPGFPFCPAPSVEKKNPNCDLRVLRLTQILHPLRDQIIPPDEQSIYHELDPSVPFPIPHFPSRTVHPPRTPPRPQLAIPPSSHSALVRTMN